MKRTSLIAALVLGLLTAGSLWGQHVIDSSVPLVKPDCLRQTPSGAYEAIDCKFLSTASTENSLVIGTAMCPPKQLKEVLELALSYIDDPAGVSYPEIVMNDLVLRPFPSRLEIAEKQIAALKKKAADVKKIREALECVSK